MDPHVQGGGPVALGSLHPAQGPSIGPPAGQDWTRAALVLGLGYVYLGLGIVGDTLFECGLGQGPRGSLDHLGLLWGDAKLGGLSHAQCHLLLDNPVDMPLDYRLGDLTGSL